MSESAPVYIIDVNVDWREMALLLEHQVARLTRALNLIADGVEQCEFKAYFDDLHQLLGLCSDAYPELDSRWCTYCIAHHALHRASTGGET